VTDIHRDGSVEEAGTGRIYLPDFLWVAREYHHYAPFSRSQETNSSSSPVLKPRQDSTNAISLPTPTLNVDVDVQYAEWLKKLASQCKQPQSMNIAEWATYRLVKKVNLTNTATIKPHCSKAVLPLLEPHSYLPVKIRIVIAGQAFFYKPLDIEWMFYDCTQSILDRIETFDFITQDQIAYVRMMRLSNRIRLDTHFPDPLLIFDAPFVGVAPTERMNNRDGNIDTSAVSQLSTSTIQTTTSEHTHTTTRRRLDFDFQ